MNYKSLLYEIQNANVQGPTTDEIIVPSNISLYTVNLDTREIDAPEYLSVQHEHYAETVYFLVDRYHDRMDLAQTNCVIQYITPDNESYVYVVPFCDTVTYENKMIIPWSISGSATKLSGTVKYILRFYLIDEQSVEEGGPSNAQFAYSLSTKPASGKVMYGLPITVEGQIDDTAYHIDSDTRLYELINSLTQIADNATLYWIDV